MILPPIDPDIPASEGDDFDGANPRCPSCLATMGPLDTRRGPVWLCQECGTIKTA